MQFHEIQAQVVVADVRGGPDLEIIVGDLGGNLVCVNIDGDVLWDARLSGRIYQAPTVGDIDGDGTLDVVVAVAAIDGYHIYAVRGDTGQILSGYPFALPAGGEVSAPIVLVDLHDYSDTTHSRLSPATYT
ncbi:DEX1, partial [Symbiodinium microadriaticum]